MSTQTKHKIEMTLVSAVLFVLYFCVLTITAITIERAVDGKQSNTTFSQESSVPKN